jgi:hypothetical protein
MKTSGGLFLVLDVTTAPPDNAMVQPPAAGASLRLRLQASNFSLDQPGFELCTRTAAYRGCATCWLASTCVHRCVLVSDGAVIECARAQIISYDDMHQVSRPQPEKPRGTMYVHIRFCL